MESTDEAIVIFKCLILAWSCLWADHCNLLASWSSLLASWSSNNETVAAKRVTRCKFRSMRRHPHWVTDTAQRGCNTEVRTIRNLSPFNKKAQELDMLKELWCVHNEFS